MEADLDLDLDPSNARLISQRRMQNANAGQRGEAINKKERSQSSREGGGA